MFLSIKNNYKQKKRIAKSFFDLEVNPLQVFDDVTDE